MAGGEKHRATAVGLLAGLFLAAAGSGASAASTFTKLADIRPGTEVVTLVSNGSFETGSSMPAHADPLAFPLNWDRMGHGRYGAPPATTNFPTGTASFGANVGLAPVGPPPGAANSGHAHHAVTLLANTDYVLSGYLWNFSYDPTPANPNSGDERRVTGNIDSNDRAGGIDTWFQTTLPSTMPDVDKGYYITIPFSTKPASPLYIGGALTDFRFRVFYNFLSIPAASTWNGPVGGGSAMMMDRFAITPASTYVAPAMIPEPSSALFLAISATLTLAHRRRS